VSAAAVDQDGAAIPLPLHGNTLEWTAPKGTWTVLLVDHEFRTSPTRSDTNPQRVKDASQSLEDYLDPAATEQYLRFTHEQYKKVVGDEFGKTSWVSAATNPITPFPACPGRPGSSSASARSRATMYNRMSLSLRSLPRAATPALRFI
jgi:hypothetical protein